MRTIYAITAHKWQLANRNQIQYSLCNRTHQIDGEDNGWGTVELSDASEPNANGANSAQMRFVGSILEISVEYLRLFAT